MNVILFGLLIHKLHKQVMIRQTNGSFLVFSAGNVYSFLRRFEQRRLDYNSKETYDTFMHATFA